MFLKNIVYKKGMLNILLLLDHLGNSWYLIHNSDNIITWTANVSSDVTITF